MKKKQSGITLMELIMGLAVLGLIMMILLKYTNEQAKELRLQNAAKQMEKVLSDVEEYVKENFSKVYDAASTSSSGVIGSITIDGVSTTLIDAAYSTNVGDIVKYNKTAPMGGTYHAVARLSSGSSENSLQVILYLINGSKNIKFTEASIVSQKIMNGKGGVVYNPASPINPCGTASFCVANAHAVWQIIDGEVASNSKPNIIDISDTMPNPDGSGSSVSIRGVLGVFPEVVDGFAPAIAAVNNITATDAASPYLSKEEDLQNLAKNTLETDINIDDRSDGVSSIFFNGLSGDGDGDGTIDDGIQSGVAISFYDEKKSCSSFDVDSDGDGTNDTCSALDMTVQPPHIVVERKRNLNVNPNDSLLSDPSFIAEGGIKTNLIKVEGESCDASLYGKVIAVDELTGNLLHCYVGENYNLNTSTGLFLGDWRKIDWKKSLYLLSRKIRLASGTGPLTDTITTTELETVVKSPVHGIAELVFIKTAIKGTGYLNINGTTVNTQSGSQNDVVYTLIPYTSSGIQVEAVGTNIGQWEVEIIGYINLD